MSKVEVSGQPSPTDNPKVSIRFKTPYPQAVEDLAMNSQNHASHALPPGPSDPLWGLNHLRSMKADYLGFVADLQRQHPDIAHVQVLNEHINHVFHPEWVREVLVDQAAALIRW